MDKALSLVTYSCPECGFCWSVMPDEVSKCNIQLCPECSCMVGLNQEELLILCLAKPKEIVLWQKKNKTQETKKKNKTQETKKKNKNQEKGGGGSKEETLSTGPLR